MRLLTTFVFSLVLSAAPPSRLAQVDRIFSGFNNHTPGCAVGVAVKGEVELQAGYGMADLERGVAITPQTIFESGSVAKQFTAAALMLLAQQGRISLDDPMRKYLPELRDYGAPVTIRQVLSHISGLREWRPLATFGGMAEGKFVYTNQDLLRMAARQKGLNFDPGTAYSYTNTGFNISTILIERALGGGKTFQQFTQDQIFGPLKMNHTRWRDDFRRVVPGRALAYGRQGEVWVNQTPIENIIGAGGLLTTVGDLLLWNENFVHARVGGPEFVKQQQTPATLASGRQISYAAGLAVSTMDGLREVSHSGATGGYRTWLGRYPDQALSVAVMCNSAEANPVRLGRETARLWTGTQSAKEGPEFPVALESLKSLAGYYRKLRDNTVAELRYRDGRLWLEPNLELKPVAAGKFSNAAAGREISFEGSGFRVLTSVGDIAYERVELVTPGTGQLGEYAGNYSSEETASTLSVTHDPTSGKLQLRIGDNPPLALEPTFRDAFAMPGGGALRFLRNASGRVNAVSAGEDRVWDLRFERVP